jgi:hypothetical protein
MASTIISEYLGRGLASARPVTPNVPAGVSALYFSTDTGILSAWDGSGWVNVTPTGGGGALTLVQHTTAARATISSGITLSSAPVDGNFLLAVVFRNNTTPATTTGAWNRPFSTQATGWSVGAFYKVAGSSESATQVPTASTGSGGIAIWEFENVRAIAASASAANASNTGLTANATLVRTRTGTIVGASAGISGDVPTMSGAVANDQSFSSAGVIGGRSFVGTPNSFESTTYGAISSYPASTANATMSVILA